MKNTAAYSLLLLLLAVTSVKAQMTIVYTGEMAMLTTDVLKHGQIQWQRSSDMLQWNDVPGWVGDSVLFFPDTIPQYYRGKVSSGSCDTIYTDIQGIKLFKCGDTIIDYRDGRAYPSVLIGTQCWMAKNLAVGDMINGALNMENNAKIERYCYDNDTLNCDYYGALYQWDEMMQYTLTEGTQGICPKGFHVPSDQDILELELYLGMDPSSATMVNFWRGSNQGFQLKPGGSSGFNANFTGVRYESGLFYNIGVFEFIYTSTSNTSNNILAWRRCLSTSDPGIGRFNNTLKTIGSSVRCLKN